MTKNNFIHIAGKALFVSFVLFTLSGCVLTDTKMGAQNAQIIAADDAVNPLDLHNALQPDLNNQECPVTQDDTAYRLGAEDEITLKIYGEDDLSGTYKIQNSGSVTIPLIGETTLSGCTLGQAERLLFTKFTDGYLIDPSIAISVSKHRPFYILGEVREPGRYDYIVDMNGLQAVAMAGGFTYRADKKSAKILRGQKNAQPVYERVLLEQNIHPGDVIFIKERFF